MGKSIWYFINTTVIIASNIQDSLTQTQTHITGHSQSYVDLRDLLGGGRERGRGGEGERGREVGEREREREGGGGEREYTHLVVQ